MNESTDPLFDFENNDRSISRYEHMSQEGRVSFFDVNEFEDIIDYYVELNKIDKAFDVIKIAKAQHPSCFALKVREAELLTIIKRPTEALNIIESIEHLEVSNADIYLIKASIFSQLDDKTKAIACFHKAAEYTNEALDEIHINLAYLHESSKNYEKAIEHLQYALAENPNSENVLYEIAYCYEQIDRLPECIVYFDKFLDNNPYSAHAWYNLGYIYNKTDEHKKALFAYDYAIVIDENFTEAYFNKANTLNYLERYHSAIEVYKESYEIHPNKACTNYFIGECYEKLEDYYAAMEHYHLSIQLDEEYADSWMGIGVCLGEQNKLEESIHYMRQAISFDDSNADFHFMLAETEQKLGQFSAAKTSFEKVIDLAPECEDAWLDYSKMLFDYEFFEKAIEVITEGLKLHTESSEIHYRLVAYLFQIGYDADASDILKNALELDFNGHCQLFEFMPQCKSNNQVLELIETHKL